VPCTEDLEIWLQVQRQAGARIRFVIGLPGDKAKIEGMLWRTGLYYTTPVGLPVCEDQVFQALKRVVPGIRKEKKYGPSRYCV
jgi:hypothetical protein